MEARLNMRWLLGELNRVSFHAWDLQLQLDGVQNVHRSLATGGRDSSDGVQRGGAAATPQPAQGPQTAPSQAGDAVQADKQ